MGSNRRKIEADLESADEGYARKVRQNVLIRVIEVKHLILKGLPCVNDFGAHGDGDEVSQPWVLQSQPKLLISKELISGTTLDVGLHYSLPRLSHRHVEEQQSRCFRAQHDCSYSWVQRFLPASEACA